VLGDSEKELSEFLGEGEDGEEDQVNEDWLDGEGEPQSSRLASICLLERGCLCLVPGLQYPPYDAW